MVNGARVKVSCHVFFFSSTVRQVLVYVIRHLTVLQWTDIHKYIQETKDTEEKAKLSLGAHHRAKEATLLSGRCTGCS